MERSNNSCNLTNGKNFLRITPYAKIKSALGVKGIMQEGNF
jgi:hypothetical protein